MTIEQLIVKLALTRISGMRPFSACGTTAAKWQWRHCVDHHIRAAIEDAERITGLRAIIKPE
jgi:hypothetical protein